MKRFINQYFSKVVTRLSGDITSLHKGVFERKEAYIWSKSDRAQSLKENTSQSLAWERGDKGSLKSAFKETLAEGLFQGKPLFVPNISRINIDLQGPNPALLGAGIGARFGSHKTLWPGRNKRVNRYLRFMYLRLFRLIPLPKKFWTVGLHFLIRSNSYLLATHISINKNAYRELHIKTQKRIYQAVNAIRAHNTPARVIKRYAQANVLEQLLAFMVQSKRVFIPVPGKTKPFALGVPALPWRIFNKMILLLVMLVVPIGDYQHGFLPRKGTMTAWNTLSKYIRGTRNIYEIDFKGYFPSIQSKTVSMQLYNLSDLPRSIIAYFEQMNNSISTVPPIIAGIEIPEVGITEGVIIQLKNEMKVLMRRLGFGRAQDHFDPNFSARLQSDSGNLLDDITLKINHLFLNNKHLEGSRRFRPLAKLATDFHDTEYNHLAFRRWQKKNVHSQTLGKPKLDLSRLFTGMHVDPLSPAANWDLGNLTADQIQQIENSQSLLQDLKDPFVFTGLPRGLPSSPFFSIVVMEQLVAMIKEHFPSIRVLAYADDMIFSGNDDNEFERFVNDLPELCNLLGLTISKEKSKVSKKGGVWLTDRVKFLGISYYPSTDQFWSTTRKGRTLLYDYESLITFGLNLENNVVLQAVQALKIPEHEQHHFLHVLYLIDSLYKAPASQRGLFFNRMLETLQPHDYPQILRYLEIIASEKSLDNVHQSLPGRKPLKKLVSANLELIQEIISKLTQPEKGQPIFGGPYGGLILSRLYMGSKVVPAFQTDTGSQDFILRMKPGSIAHRLRSVDSSQLVNLRTGSSFAVRPQLDLLRSLSRKGKLTIGTGVVKGLGFKS
jgi:hypothetical protein